MKFGGIRSMLMGFAFQLAFLLFIITFRRRIQGISVWRERYKTSILSRNFVVKYNIPHPNAIKPININIDEIITPVNSNFGLKYSSLLMNDITAVYRVIIEITKVIETKIILNL
jgi:hypothetical protein